MSLETVRSATVIPSFKSSPWILGAPHRGLAAAIRLTKARTSAFDGRAAHGGLPGQLRPVLAEATALPSQDGRGGHNHEGAPPPGPDAGQSDPEEPIPWAEVRPGHCALVDGELLAQGEVLQGQLP